jgi:hypothetical protein
MGQDRTLKQDRVKEVMRSKVMGGDEGEAEGEMARGSTRWWG